MQTIEMARSWRVSGEARSARSAPRPVRAPMLGERRRRILRGLPFAARAERGMNSADRLGPMRYTIRSAGAHEQALRRAADQSGDIEDARLREAASCGPDERACIDADPLALRRPQQVDGEIGVHEGVVA